MARLHTTRTERPLTVVGDIDAYAADQMPGRKRKLRLTSDRATGLLLDRVAPELARLGLPTSLTGTLEAESLGGKCPDGAASHDAPTPAGSAIAMANVPSERGSREHGNVPL